MIFLKAIARINVPGTISVFRAEMQQVGDVSEVMQA